FYREMHIPPIDKFDEFNEGKMQSFFESQQAIKSLCTYLQELITNMENMTEIQLRDSFLKLLQVSLWGNKCDLSISAGQDNSQKSSPIDSLPDLQRCILVDDSNMVWSMLVAAQGSRSSGIKNARVDIVLDNAGFELVTDLVLASFLVSAGLAKQIRFHGKSIPWFVSDVTKQDFEWTIMQTVASNHKWMSASGVQWKHFMKEGTWSYHDHSFWTLPHEFCDMAVDAADLYSTLQGSDLIIFKGDLNYRKLTGDRKWEHTVRFDQALRGFQPAPLCSLRTLKADVQVGLQLGQAEKLSSQDPDWMTNGKYAVVQFCSPHREQ
uniref:Sugar phosphate phosphatase n=1 Tax=Sinocyclocheilus grahami TaxID=75366 RepID=A0A672R293_SINGR